MEQFDVKTPTYNVTSICFQNILQWNSRTCDDLPICCKHPRRVPAISVFFFSFAYTTSPAAVMKLVVFFRSSKPFLVKRSCWRPLCDSLWLVSVTYLKKMLGSLVLLTTGTRWEGTIFSSLCMCALSLLWPERSRAWKTTWPGLSRRWYATFSFLGFSAVLMMVVFSW